MSSAYIVVAAFVAKVAVKVFAASEGQTWQ